MDIYTDTKYAFLVLHAHAAIWKERGYLNAKQGPIKYGRYILQLLEAVQLTKQIAVIHCGGLQKGTDEITTGNNLANHTAKTATTTKSPILGTLIHSINWNNLLPQYTKEEIDWADQHEYTKDKREWYQKDYSMESYQRLT